MLLEELGEELGAALAVGLIGEEDGHGLGFPVFGHVVRQDFGLLVDAGAAPAEGSAVAAQLGGGGGGADGHHLGVIGDFAGSHHVAGSHGADDGHHLVHVDELLHRVDRSGGRVFFILHDQLDLAAVDATGLVHLIHGHFHAPAAGDAMFGADGQAHHRADFNGFGPEGGPGD